MTNNLKVIDIAIRMFVLGIIIFWCYIILRPFISIILWGIILAIAFFPIFLRLKSLMGGRKKLAVTLITLVGIGIIFGPVTLMAKAFVDNIQTLANSLKAGTLMVPPPPEDIANWPIIGEALNNIWQKASVNLEEVLVTFEPQIKKLATRLLLIGASVGLAILQFIFSIIIAAVLMLNAESLKGKLSRLIMKLTPKQGEAFITLASVTLRNVVRGVIGVAAIQTLMVGIGFIVGGIPSAGLLTIICLILTIIQIGPGLIVLGAIIFAWSNMNTLSAVIFTIWMICAILIDNVLKPILMARGLPVPMIVILIGVIGGTLAHGIIGLFIGPVILALGYELMKAWVNDEFNGEKILENKEDIA